MNRLKFLHRWLLLLALASLLTSCLPRQVDLAATPSHQKSLTPVFTSTSTSEPTLIPSATPKATLALTALPLATPTLAPTPPPYLGLVPQDARLRISKGGIQFVALSPDGKDVLIASNIILCSYRVMEGSENWCRTTGDTPGSALQNNYDDLAISPDGKTLATALQNGNIVLWNRTMGEQKLVIQTNLSFMSNLDWSPDNQKLAITTRGTGTPPGVVQIFDSQDGKLLQKLISEYIDPYLIRWSPDGTRIAASDGSQVAVFDVTTDNEIFRKVPFTQLYSTITSLEWSADRTTVIAGSRIVSCAENCHPKYNGKIAFLDARSGTTVRQIDVGQPVENLALSLDGSFLAGVNWNPGVVKLYRMRDGSLVRTFPQAGTGNATLADVKDVSWFPDSQRLLTLDDEDNLTVWDISGAKASESHLDGYIQITGMAWSPDGSQLATNSTRGLFIWDDLSGLLLRRVGAEDQYEKIAWSPDGKTLASAKDKQVFLWDAQTGKQIRSLTASGDYPRDLGWSKDGNLFASLSLSGFPIRYTFIDIWNTSDWSRSQVIKIDYWEENNPEYFAWSPEGKTLATIGRGINLWDVSSGKLARTFVRDLGLFSSIAWSPDGQNLLTVMEGLVMIVDAGSGAIRVQIKSDENNYLTSAAFSPDGKIIATGGNDINLYNSQDGKLLKTLSGYADVADRLAFSPDGKTLVSGSADGTVILWNIPRSSILLAPPVPTANNLTPVPSGVFALMYYPPLILDYDPFIWKDASRYTDSSITVNYLQARNLKTCVLGPEGANGDFPSPDEVLNLGTIKYQVSHHQNKELGLIYLYIVDPSQSSLVNNAGLGLPKLNVYSSPSEWNECKTLAEKVLSTLHFP